MRIIVLLDIADSPDYADAKDVADSVVARVCDEAGYLDNGAVVGPAGRVSALVCTDGGKPLGYSESIPFSPTPVDA